MYIRRCLHFNNNRTVLNFIQRPTPVNTLKRKKSSIIHQHCDKNSMKKLQKAEYSFFVEIELIQQLL
jgi:hypothetical protein